MNFDSSGYVASNNTNSQNNTNSNSSSTNSTNSNSTSNSTTNSTIKSRYLQTSSSNNDLFDDDRNRYILSSANDVFELYSIYIESLKEKSQRMLL